MTYRRYIKRIVDISVALVVLICLFPIFVAVALLLSWVNKGSPFFFQTRPGKNGRPFRIIKFKTMKDLRNPKGELLSDGDRLTRAGRFIRKTSLDEIPQLLNVLYGDMSLIGPRPLLMEYLPLYNEVQRRRHEVAPGITGWAQVNGRNAIGWEEKFRLDVWYVDHVSFLVDAHILFKTMLKIFRSEGISQEGQATVQYFMGNQPAQNVQA